jgi:hypothetical protein
MQQAFFMKLSSLTGEREAVLRRSCAWDEHHSKRMDAANSSRGAWMSDNKGRRLAMRGLGVVETAPRRTCEQHQATGVVIQRRDVHCAVRQHGSK